MTKTAYRGQHEIMFCILETCNVEGGLVKTKIMYNAYLSHDQLESYMKKMTDYGLIENIPLTNRFAITGRGRRALELFRELDGILRV